MLPTLINGIKNKLFMVSLTDKTMVSKRQHHGVPQTPPWCPTDNTMMCHGQHHGMPQTTPWCATDNTMACHRQHHGVPQTPPWCATNNSMVSRCSSVIKPDSRVRLVQSVSLCTPYHTTLHHTLSLLIPVYHSVSPPAYFQSVPSVTTSILK
jgi:hypothetical protein